MPMKHAPASCPVPMIIIPLPVMLPDCRSGQISTFARPATSEGRLTFFAATKGDNAVSSWNSPSMQISGRCFA